MPLPPNRPRTEPAFRLGALALAALLAVPAAALAGARERSEPTTRVFLTTGGVLDVVEAVPQGSLTRLRLTSGGTMAIPSNRIEQLVSLVENDATPRRGGTMSVAAGGGGGRAGGPVRTPANTLRPKLDSSAVAATAVAGSRSAPARSPLDLRTIAAPRPGTATVRPTTPVTLGSRPQKKSQSSVQAQAERQRRYARLQAKEEALRPAPGKMGQILDRVNGGRLVRPAGRR